MQDEPRSTQVSSLRSFAHDPLAPGGDAPRFSRNAGNAAAVAMVLALIIIGVVGYFFVGVSTTGPTPGGGPVPTTGSSNIPEFAPTEEATETAFDPLTEKDTPALGDSSTTVSDLFYGRALDFEENPIALVTVRRLDGPWQGSVDLVYGDAILTIPVRKSGEGLAPFENAPQVLTQADGSFEIAGKVGDALSLSAPGFAPVLARISPNDSLSPDPPQRIDEATDEALSNALRDMPFDAGELGRFRSPNDVSVEVSATPTAADRRDLTLGPAIFVTGSVTSAVDGSPATGTEVTIREGADVGMMAMMMAQNGNSRRSRVNDLGEYAIVLEKAGDYRVGVRSGATDFAPTPLDAYPAVRLQMGDTEHVVNFTVEPGGALEGMLVDAKGIPITGQNVTAFPQMEITDFTSGGMLGRLDPRKTETLEDGSFRIGGLPLDIAYNASATVPDLARTTVLSDKLTLERPIALVHLVAVRGSSISGTVVTELGKPLGGVQVAILPDFQALMEGGVMAAADFSNAPVTSEDDGTFTLEHLHAGEYNLVAGDAMANFNPFGGDSGGELVEVDGVSDVTGVVLVAPPEAENLRGDLTGWVRDKEGNPLRGAAVTITETNDETLPDGEPAELVLTTDGSGRFFAKDAAIAETMVEAELAGFSSEIEFLEAGQTEVTLVLELVATIRGRVVLSDGSPPGIDFRVSAEEVTDDGTSSLETQLSTMMGGGLLGDKGNDDGTFELTEVPLGTVEVVARASGFAKARSVPITLSAGDVVEGIELVLTRGAKVLGTVVDPNGTPLSGAKVTCTPASSSGGMQDLIAQAMPAMFAGGDTGLTSSDGTYEIPNLEPGEYVLRALHDQYARSEPVTITVRPELDTAAPHIAMLIGGMIEGSASRDGEPIPRMMVQAFSKGAMKQAVTDQAGRFRFENLPDGDFAVMFMDIAGAMRPGGGSGMRTRMVEVVAGTTATVDVTFGTGHTVKGKIENAPDTPMRMLVLRKKGGPAPEDIDPLDMEAAMESARFQVAMAILGSEGEFEIKDVEPGEYILEMPKMPENPMDMEGYSKIDRVPYVRKEVTVGSSDVTVNARATD